MKKGISAHSFHNMSAKSIYKSYKQYISCQLLYIAFISTLPLNTPYTLIDFIV